MQHCIFHPTCEAMAGSLSSLSGWLGTNFLRVHDLLENVRVRLPSRFAGIGFETTATKIKIQQTS